MEKKSGKLYVSITCFDKIELINRKPGELGRQDNIVKVY